MQAQAKIISYTINCGEICASAARISTTQGDAYRIFEASKGNEKNPDLIEKVLKSGHKSIIEHAVFTIAFWNVSVFVEQYLIECRLASFTVKSRRYVDFRSFGYYIPPELEGEPLAQYRRYMEPLFSAYGKLLDAGVPKEDARFILPYSFHSSFYCTLNARELIHIIASIRHGRGSGSPELRYLADQLTAQAKEIFPSLLPELERAPLQGAGGGVSPLKLSASPCFVEARNAGAAKLLSAPSAPLEILRAAYQISSPGESFRADKLLSSIRPRELEQLTYSFVISDITLSGITHLVRHRMQSLIVPPVQCADHSRYIAPDSIAASPQAWEIYSGALRTAHEMLQEIAHVPSLERYGCYFAVSGNMMNVMTTVNARELKLFIQLRTCRRAQWEIRGTAVSMLDQLRAHCPELYHYFGPSCYLLGYCPEGKLTCGSMDEVRSSFGAAQ